MRLPSRVARATAALAMLALTASACSSSTAKTSSVPQTSAPSRTGRSVPTSTSPSSTTNPPSPAATGEANDLRAKLMDHGLCDKLTQFLPYLGVPVTSLLSCDDGYGIMVTASSVERDQIILVIAQGACTDSTYLAVGDNWIVWPIPSTETRAGTIVEILGGEVRALPCTRD